MTDDPTPTAEANAAGEYLEALLHRNIEIETAVRLTTAWILSRGNAKAVGDAVRELGENEEGVPWRT